MNNNIFKYLFSAFVIILILGTMIFIVKNRSKSDDYSLDQTSTASNIQTDLRLAIAEYDTINPLLTKNRNIEKITKIIYEPLITLNENYKLEYCLAESITKEDDDITYDVKLREGVLWTDNSNFTSNDVKFTFDLIKSGSFSTIYSDNVKYVSSVEIVDDYNIKIVLSQPVSFFEYNLTFPIMCMSYYDGDDFSVNDRTPIGTGMFKISDASSNVINLVANEQYWNQDKKPIATKVTLNIYENMGDAYTAFKNGEIDIIPDAAKNVEDYIGTLGYNKIEYKSRDYDFLAINTQSSILSNASVRKAISLAIDKNTLVASCCGTRVYCF